MDALLDLNTFSMSQYITYLKRYIHYAKDTCIYMYIYSIYVCVYIYMYDMYMYLYFYLPI